jgi:alpha-galactosidase
MNLEVSRRTVSVGLASIPFAAVAPAFQTSGSRLATIENDLLTLTNGLVRRVLRLPTPARPRLATVDYRPVEERSRFFSGAKNEWTWEALEFGFRMDGREYGHASGWALAGLQNVRAPHGGEGVELVLRSADALVEASLRYLLYPGSTVMRKRLTIKNLSSASVPLEDLDVESFTLEHYHPGTHGWVYSDYGRRKSLAPFQGGRQDSLVALHNPDWGQGVVLGNEAPGVMKYIGVNDGALRFRAGLARSDAPLPFRRWLDAGESYVAPQVFSLVYAGHRRFETVLSTQIPQFVRKHMGTRLSAYPRKPTFVYNTWEPFQKNIDEKLVMELATSAAAAGAKTFVIDDGWQDIYGDWNVDQAKFPRGLRPVMDHIKRLGMKPGLWISIGSAETRSKVFREHPEWFVRNAEGRHYSVHADADTDKMTACMSTGWRGYMQQLLNRLVREHGLEYVKLDFAVVTSPYQYDPAKAGCYAPGHPGHHDRAESLSTNYDHLWTLFDAFKAQHPHVFIDCTFETMGGNQLIDYAMLQHAEGNWLSNFVQADELNDLRVRNMAWWRSPAMPATSLVIGNSRLNDVGFEMHLKSLAGSLPIFLGDPRAMSDTARALSKRYSDFFARVQMKHDAFSFRQDLEGFGEPSEGAWDGFQRINLDTLSGGLVGVFRHGAREPSRRAYVSWLAPDRRYAVRRIDGSEVLRATGRELRDTGWDVTIAALYGGELFEVSEAA